MAKLIHSMFRVLDLERSVDFYREVLGLQEIRRLDFPSFTLVYLRDHEGGFEVELTLNKGQAEPYATGEGYGHLAACVPDLKQEHLRLSGCGYDVGAIKQLVHDGKTVGEFFFLSDPDGHRIEMLQRNGVYR
jgi:lactoylglutathione lyase